MGSPPSRVSLIEVVRLSAYLPRNARALMRARQLGGQIKYLSQGEIEARNRGYSPYSVDTWRTWEYWANKAGCGHLLGTKDMVAHGHPESSTLDVFYGPTLVFLLYQKGRDARIFQAQDRAIDDFTLKGISAQHINRSVSSELMI
jgi:hypothetical protein